MKWKIDTSSHLGAALCFMISVAPNVVLADPAPKVPLWGAGKVVCRDWQRSNAVDRWAAENWVFGFLNAYNYFQNALGPYVGETVTG